MQSEIIIWAGGKSTPHLVTYNQVCTKWRIVISLVHINALSRLKIPIGTACQIVLYFQCEKFVNSHNGKTRPH